ncbi:MAG: type II secretion system F family protein [Bdellovibrionaceae bacterium]|nr:type II secretion system F family protein [Pseudobdellovibrionaceae bacterium]
MDIINKLLGSHWIALPLIGLCVATIVYMWFDKILNKVMGSAASNRSEILRYLNLMHVEVNPRHVDYLLFFCSFGLGLAFFLLLWPRATIGLIIGGTVGGFMWRVPLLLIRSQWEKRNQKLVDQMVDGLTIMANGIKAGLSVPQSMERVVENLPNPISQEFRLVLSQIRMGRSVEEALLDLGERIPKADVQMFVTAINILKETGGNLAETFTTIVVTIRERQKIERKIEAMTAQGIMQGFIVSMVPIGLIALFYFIDPGYIMPMFTSTLGIILLMIMFAFIIIGGVAIRKVVTIKV